jgi:hypothetical protein
LYDDPRQEDLKRYGEVLLRLELVLGCPQARKESATQKLDLTDPLFVRHPINGKPRDAQKPIAA